MKTEQIQKQNITEIADRLEQAGELEFYWDYRDRLTDEQVIKIITDSEGLNDVENEIWEYNIDYIDEIITDRIKELNLDLTEEEQEDLRLECESRFNFNLDGLLRNSETRIRVTLESNEDMVYFGNDKDTTNSETIKEFKRRFRNKYKKADLDEEINNVFDYGLFTFFFKVRGNDILRLREQVLKGFIELRKGLNFGLFDSYNGSGSVLEMELLHSIKLHLRDWRIKDTKEEVLNALENKNSDYWNISIKADEISKYGIQQVYGLTGEAWADF